MAGIRTQGLDHVHIRVADRERAAAWYKNVLGLEPAPQFSVWASDPTGPLFLSTQEGARCLALFKANTEHNRLGDHTVAFAVAAGEFISFMNKLDELQLVDRDGTKVTKDEIADHELSWSFYFIDPDGNRFELTSYQYEVIAAHLARR